MGELWIIDTKLSSEKYFSSGSDHFVNRVVISRFGEFCKRYSSWFFQNPPVTSSFGKYKKKTNHFLSQSSDEEWPVITHSNSLKGWKCNELKEKLNYNHPGGPPGSGAKLWQFRETAKVLHQAWYSSHCFGRNKECGTISICSPRLQCCSCCSYWTSDHVTHLLKTVSRCD